MLQQLQFRPRQFRLATMLVTGASLFFLVSTTGADEAEQCGLVDIDHVGWTTIDTIKRTPGAHWWTELDDRLLVCGTADSITRIESGHHLKSRWSTGAEAELMLSRGRTTAELESDGFRVIASSGGAAIVDASIAVFVPPPVFDRSHRDRWLLTPLPHDAVVLRQAANAPPRPEIDFPPEVQTMVDQVNGNLWFDDVVSLAAFNRYTHSPDNLNARDWLVSQFQALPGLTVTTPAFAVFSTTAYNVVARLEGAAASDEWYVVGGHYDSASENPSGAAPGAEDNASGCAGVLEMARIFTAYQPQATILFICYSGEEQGLYGSEAHVAELAAAGDLDKIQAMLDMDMIGYTADADLDCLLETEAFAQSLLDTFAGAAADYTQLRIIENFFALGSDHVPYLDAGIPALLTIEYDYFEYPDYHRTTDVPANLTIAMAVETLKMNVAALAVLTDTDPIRIFVDGFESGGTSSWSTVAP